VLRCIVAVLCALGAAAASAQTKQEQVHGMSHTVMPFDMAKTRHYFAMRDDGGVQRVVVLDKADAQQIALIRMHLRHEAEAFQRGDFSDPTHLHGAGMAGLADVQAAAKDMRVSYAELPDGAQIAYSSQDRHVVTAIHRWFGAQLSEHGADAQLE